MCIETHTLHRRCTHTRFLRWDYCSILIPRDRLPSTGRLCRRYKLRYVEAKRGEECVECARERVVNENTPVSTLVSGSFTKDVSGGGGVGGERGGNGVGGGGKGEGRKRGEGRRFWRWLNAPVSNPVPLSVGYQVPSVSGHAASSTWAAMSNVGNSTESRVAVLPTPVEEEVEELEVYGRGDYQYLGREDVPAEKMSLAELLRTPPHESFAAAPPYAAKQGVVPRVEMHGGGGVHQYSAFPAPMRGGERVVVGNGSNEHEPKGEWEAPESWGVGGEKKGERNSEVVGKRETKEKWYKGLFKYHEGYTGGAF